MKKQVMIIAGIVLLVSLLTGAAFVGGRLLNGQGLPFLPSSNGPMISIGQGGKGKAIQLDIQPAKELPQQSADTRGLFDHRQNNSIFVGTGNKITVSVQKDPNGNLTTSANHDGPTVEVVVTTQTVIYSDVTLNQFDGPPPSGQKIQQVLEPGTLDEIGQNSMVTVWGKKTGERFIADVLVYSAAAIKIKR